MNRALSSILCGSFKRTYTSIPFVIDKSTGGVERSYDIYSRLLRDRIIFMTGPINDLSSNSVVAQLLYLESTAPEKPIQMYINSPGGSVYDAFAIYDTMRYITAPVHTFCVGLAASAGSLLLAAGTPGKRFALQNSRIMVHQPSGGASGQASDVAIVAQEILRIRSQLNKIYSTHTDQPIETIEKYMERDSYLDANEALKFGIIDSIITTRTEVVAA
jgi:ATP-dependent Clp protease protease subunit